MSLSLSPFSQSDLTPFGSENVPKTHESFAVEGSPDIHGVQGITPTGW